MRKTAALALVALAACSSDAPGSASQALEPGGGASGGAAGASVTGGTGGASGKANAGSAGTSGKASGGTTGGGAGASGSNAGGTGGSAEAGTGGMQTGSAGTAGGIGTAGTSAAGTSAAGTSAAGTSAAGTSAGGTSAGGSGTTKERIWGVTVDDVAPLASILDSLSHLAKRPTTRIVFDLAEPPDYYVDPVHQIHGVSATMGQILDSSDMAAISIADYKTRSEAYLAALGDDVDVWEVGNEINGEWLGTTSDVVQKMSDAYGVIKGAGKTTELTLYYNQDCWSQADHEMFTWAAANVPADMKAGLDYVLVSYYEDDCNGLQPDWPAVFQQLGDLFPNSKIGFGECGTTTGDKTTYVHRYYRDIDQVVTHPRYVGGDFWWYFAEDMIPSSAPLWAVLDADVAAGP